MCAAVTRVCYPCGLRIVRARVPRRALGSRGRRAALPGVVVEHVRVYTLSAIMYRWESVVGCRIDGEE